MLYYGIVLDGEEHNAIGFLLRFKEATYGELKAKLLNRELTMTKRIKFFQVHLQRVTNNKNFMAAWRFFLYEGDKNKLRKVTL